MSRRINLGNLLVIRAVPILVLLDGARGRLYKAELSSNRRGSKGLVTPQNSIINAAPDVKVKFWADSVQQEPVFGPYSVCIQIRLCTTRNTIRPFSPETVRTESRMWDCGRGHSHRMHGTCGTARPATSTSTHVSSRGVLATNSSLLQISP